MPPWQGRTIGSLQRHAPVGFPGTLVGRCKSNTHCCWLIQGSLNLADPFMMLQLVNGYENLETEVGCDKWCPKSWMSHRNKILGFSFLHHQQIFWQSCLPTSKWSIFYFVSCNECSVCSLSTPRCAHTNECSRENTKILTWSPITAFEKTLLLSSDDDHHQIFIKHLIVPMLRMRPHRGKQKVTWL